MGWDRKLYYRELIARFGHNLALNWNLGEENTQTTEEQIRRVCNTLLRLTRTRIIECCTPTQKQQDSTFTTPFIGRSELTGLSLQNSHIRDTHHQTAKWVKKSNQSQVPWVVAFDESGSAAHGQCPDLGYQGFDGRDSDGKMTYTEHEVRHQTLWGTLMAGGAGVEYYFGYKYPENDLKCEDWRSRDRSWDYCRFALEFFHDNEVPFWEMKNRDDLVGNENRDNSVYCLAKSNECYVVYIPKKENGGNLAEQGLDLSGTTGEFTIKWYNPRRGGALVVGSKEIIDSPGPRTRLGMPPEDTDEDWVALVRKEK